MKIMFIYPNLGGPLGISMGISVLSSVLKANNNEVYVLHLNEELGFPLDFSRIEQEIHDFAPSIIGFSVNTNQVNVALRIAEYIKKNISPSITTVFGGIHATLNPGSLIKKECVDIINIGEGDESFIELVENIKRGESIDKIRNIWLKSDGKIIKNRLRQLVDLRDLPFSDFSVFKIQDIIDLRNGWIDVLIGRGCNYNCTYCFNKAYKETYKKNGNIDISKKYIRCYDFDKVIRELKAIVRKYKNIKRISFVDDNILDYPGIEEFLLIFHKEINLPYNINTHINSINERIIQILEETKCILMRFGLESGDENLRKMVLNRKVNNEKIFKTLEIVNKYNIKTASYNMIGLPFEKEENVLKTIEVNSRISPNLVRFSFFYPYKGTELFDVCEKNNLLPDDYKTNEVMNFDSESILNFDHGFKLFLTKTFKYFDIYLNYFNPATQNYYKDLIACISECDNKSWNDNGFHSYISTENSNITESLKAKGQSYYLKTFSNNYAEKLLN